MRLSPETCTVKPLRIKNAIVASCWTYFTNTNSRVELKWKGHERTREGKTDMTESKIPRNFARRINLINSSKQPAPTPNPTRSNTNSDVLYLSKHACQTLLYHVPQINATALPSCNPETIPCPQPANYHRTHRDNTENCTLTMLLPQDTFPVPTFVMYYCCQWVAGYPQSKRVWQLHNPQG